MSGFFSRVMGAVGGDAAATPGAGNLVSQLFNDAGGVSGIITKFNQAGLGTKVQSWIGSGSNIPMLASEVEKVFPPDQIEALAQKHGLPAGAVTQLLASVLPHAVDQATPDGTAPPAGADDQPWA
jgi:uncharacterized protein YidB (DUF937 family)